MKNIIIANWKCNPSSLKEAKKLFVAETKIKGKNTEIVICPPFIYIEALGRLSSKVFSVGGQNVCFEEKGPFTGEVSAFMLKDLGAEYAIVGHSERRKYFSENNSDINKKIHRLLESKINPVLCVGETKQEFDLHQKPEVLEAQITEALAGVKKDEMKNIIIAYEPVWAIGTGQNCSVDETMASVIFIRKIISEIYNRETADSVPILYGGSVNSLNSREYLKNAGVNGLLVGGASLKAEEFVAIVKSSGQ